MKRLVMFGFLLFSFMLLVAGFSGVKAGSFLLWEGDAYSSGVPVVSSVLTSGVAYRVVASQIWFYDHSSYLAADAQYYTNSSLDTWDWVNHYRPGNHSFLQVDGQDVDWGSFSNGDTNHTYTIYVAGKGLPLTFKIVDWMDHDYLNNYCHIHVEIYGTVIVGGTVEYASQPSMARLWAFGALLLAAVLAVPVIVYVRRLK